jgi:hypothetical protein
LARRWKRQHLGWGVDEPLRKSLKVLQRISMHTLCQQLGEKLTQGLRNGCSFQRAQLANELSKHGSIREVCDLIEHPLAELDKITMERGRELL